MTRIIRGVAVIAVAALGLTGCAKQGSQTPASTTAAPPSSGASPASSQFLDEAPVVLEDGRHPVFLTSVDVAGRKITFDLIVFLTGAEAKAEWAKTHPGEGDGPPNDYLIVNNNPKLRTLPVAAGVAVKVVDLEAPGGVGLVTIPFADLNSHFASGFGLPFWITVAKGEITLIEEQFLP